MAQGFLDVDQASSLVGSAFNDASDKASSAFSSAMSLIGQLGGSVDIGQPTIAMPATPALPDLLEMPSAPGINTPSMGSVDIGNAPLLETLNLPDVDIPDFTAIEPTITIPDVPVVTDPTAPGAAPTIDDVPLPADPDIVLPDAPTLADVEIPSWGDVVAPVFDGTRPGDPGFDAPGMLFTYTEGEFSSPLQEAIESQIYNGLLAGGDITTISGITAAIGQIESLNARILRQKLNAIRDGWAARGQDGPSGADDDKERLAQLDYSDTVRESTAQLVTEQCRLGVQHFQFLIQNGISAVGMRLEAFNQAQARSLESAKATADFGYKMVETQIAVYNLQLARYQADAAVYEANIRAASLALEDRKVELETARLQGDLRKQEVDIYVAECQAQTVRVQVYQAQIQGATAKLQAQVEKVNAFKASVDAFVAQINGMVARYNAWGVQINAEKTKVDLYQAQAGAYSTRVGASKIVADIGATQANIVDARNRGNISLYQAQLDKAKVQLQQMVTEVDAALRTTAATVQAYDATVRGTTAENEGRRGLAALDVQEWSTQATSAIEQAKVLLEYARVRGSLAEQAMATSASTAAQLAASALGSRHASAQVGFSGSNQNSSHYSESYNYNQTLSA